MPTVNERFHSLPPRVRYLFDIWEFIARDEIDAADRVRDELFSAMSVIAETAEKGHFRKDLEMNLFVSGEFTPT